MPLEIEKERRKSICCCTILVFLFVIAEDLLRGVLPGNFTWAEYLCAAQASAWAVFCALFEEMKMKEMLKYLKPYRKGLLLATLAMTVSTACELLLPTIMSEILNNGVSGADLPYILRCCGWMLLVAVLSLGSVLWGTKISNTVVAGCPAKVIKVKDEKTAGKTALVDALRAL